MGNGIHPSTAEVSVLIDCLNPFGQELTLHPVPLSILTLDFQHQAGSGCQSEDEIRAVFVWCLAIISKCILPLLVAEFRLCHFSVSEPRPSASVASAVPSAPQ